MKRPLRIAVLMLAIALAPRASSAAFVNFVEATNGLDPVAVTTNLELLAPIVATAQSATVVGFIHPGNSSDPIFPGLQASAGLFVLGSPNLLSSYVLLTVGPVRDDPIFAAAQDITIQFFTQNLLVSQLPAAFPFGGGLPVNGSLQDLSSLLGTVPEGLLVRVQSPVPEPASLLLLGSGVLALAWKVRRRA